MSERNPLTIILFLPVFLFECKDKQVNISCVCREQLLRGEREREEEEEEEEGMT